MPELLNHKHCRNCSRALPYEGDDLCGRDECAREWGALTRRRARTQLLFYGAAGLFLIILLYQLVLPLL